MQSQTQRNCLSSKSNIYCKSIKILQKDDLGIYLMKYLVHGSIG